MAFVEDFTPMFADFGTAATLAGAPVVGIVELETFDDLATVVQRISFLLKPADGVTPAAGQALVVGTTSYTVRQVLMEPPDGALQRLVLVRG
jgi:hypothetical protein